MMMIISSSNGSDSSNSSNSSNSSDSSSSSRTTVEVIVDFVVLYIIEALANPSYMCY